MEATLSYRFQKQNGFFKKKIGILVVYLLGELWPYWCHWCGHQFVLTSVLSIEEDRDDSDERKVMFAMF